MVLSEAEGFLKMARADLATALESSDPAEFRSGSVPRGSLGILVASAQSPATAEP